MAFAPWFYAAKSSIELFPPRRVVLPPAVPLQETPKSLTAAR